MKKMKVMALVLAAALACMSLTACGGSKDSGVRLRQRRGQGPDGSYQPGFPAL